MKEAPPPAHSVLCLGNFDGVHVGHRALIMETSRQKERLCCYHGLACGAWLFETPPSFSLGREKVPQITTLEEKLALFASLGLDYAFLANFDELKDLEPSEFVNEILKKQCRCIYTVCGFNFRFAKNAAADAVTLQKLMEGNSKILDCVMLDGKPVSSSAIRAYLASGDIKAANSMLGRPYSLTARVLHGKAIGQTIGFPTVNQTFDTHTMHLMGGIYVSRTWIDQAAFTSVSNIGTRPSFDDGNFLNCETHIVDYTGDLYGRTVTVEFFERLRDEKRFPNIDALRDQLKRDTAAAIKFFGTKETDKT